MTKTEELKRWNRILGIDPSLEEVIKYLDTISSDANKLIHLRIIYKGLRFPDSFRRRIIATKSREIRRISFFSLDNDRINLAKRYSKWILRSGMGEEIWRKLFDAIQT